MKTNPLPTGDRGAHSKADADVFHEGTKNRYVGGRQIPGACDIKGH